MSALPQVFATDDELAATDALRDTASIQALYHTQQQSPQPQHGHNDNGYARQQQHSPSHTQQQLQQQSSPSHAQQQPQSPQQALHRTASPFQQSARSSLAASYSPQQTQRSSQYQLPSPHSH